MTYDLIDTEEATAFLVSVCLKVDWSLFFRLNHENQPTALNPVPFFSTSSGVYFRAQDIVELANVSRTAQVSTLELSDFLDGYYENESIRCKADLEQLLTELDNIGKPSQSIDKWQGGDHGQH